MHKDKIKQFLNGQQNLDEFKKSNNKSSVNSDFIEAYNQIIEESNAQKIPEFNPFEKVESYKKKRVLFAKRFLPYAAIILLSISLFFVFDNQKQKPQIQSFNDREIIELQQNTELALLHFSKELNSCLAKFNDAKRMQQPITELKSLKNVRTNSNNPLKNFKIK